MNFHFYSTVGSRVGLGWAGACPPTTISGQRRRWCWLSYALFKVRAACECRVEGWLGVSDPRRWPAYRLVTRVGFPCLIAPPPPPRVTRKLGGLKSVVPVRATVQKRSKRLGPLIRNRSKRLEPLVRNGTSLDIVAVLVSFKALPVQQAVSGVRGEKDTHVRWCK